MAAPKGNNFAGSALIAKKALEHALLDYQGEAPTGAKASKFTALVDIWKAQIAKAITDSDTQSANMIIDRLDGKPKQATELSGPDGGDIGLDLVINFIDPRVNGNTSSE